jgi:choline dehydrogenase-like flavoprotein
MWKGATQGAYFEDPALPGVLPHTLSGPPGPLLLATNKVGIEAKEAMARLDHLCGCLVMVSDHGDGWVRATSDGRADLRYWFAPEDVVMIKKGLVRAAEVVVAGGATEIFAPIRGIGTHRDVGSFADAVAATEIQDYLLYAAHPMATCRMGADPSISVVGPDGQAHGLPGLYIADSSVFPTSLGVNPQLTTMAVATVIARNLAAAA